MNHDPYVVTLVTLVEEPAGIMDPDSGYGLMITSL